MAMKMVYLTAVNLVLVGSELSRWLCSFPQGTEDGLCELGRADDSKDRLKLGIQLLNLALRFHTRIHAQMAPYLEMAAHLA